MEIHESVKNDASGARKPSEPPSDASIVFWAYVIGAVVVLGLIGAAVKEVRKLIHGEEQEEPSPGYVYTPPLPSHPTETAQEPGPSPPDYLLTLEAEKAVKPSGARIPFSAVIYRGDHLAVVAVTIEIQGQRASYLVTENITAPRSVHVLSADNCSTPPRQREADALIAKIHRLEKFEADAVAKTKKHH